MLLGRSLKPCGLEPFRSPAVALGRVFWTRRVQHRLEHGEIAALLLLAVPGYTA